MSDPAAPTVSIQDLEDHDALSDAIGHDPAALRAVVANELRRDYEVLDEIGRGGMAVVYRAREIDLGRIVALKVLLPELTVGSTMPERFKREARMAAALDHPNIIPIYRVGQSGQILYIAMKHIEGRVLDEIIESQGALPVPIVLRVLHGAASALAYAHEQGIVHRDIKGANILIQKDGRPVVSDFGVARGQSEKSMTATGAVMGTPYFMSPEQCAGKSVGPPSDQYSLGVVTFQMLSGSVPFDADSLPGVMQHHWFTPVPDLAVVRDDVPRELLDIVDRALAKKPHQRYAATSEMLRAIEAVPLPPKDREWGDAMLSELARGTSIPKVRTHPLPALQDTIHMSQPLRSVRRHVRSRLPALMATLGVAITLGAGIWAAQMRRGEGSSPASFASGDSMAVPGGAGADSAAASRPAAPTPLADASAGTSPKTGGERPATRRTPTDERGPAKGDTGRLRVASVIAPLSPSVTAASSAPAAMIRLRIDPPDAAIEIDGSVVGHGVLLDYLLPPGTHTLRATAPGYAAFDTVLTLTPGFTAQLGRRVLAAATP